MSGVDRSLPQSRRAARATWADGNIGAYVPRTSTFRSLFFDGQDGGYTHTKTAQTAGSLSLRSGGPLGGLLAQLMAKERAAPPIIPQTVAPW